MKIDKANKSVSLGSYNLNVDGYTDRTTLHKSVERYNKKDSSMTEEIPQKYKTDNPNEWRKRTWLKMYLDMMRRLYAWRDLT